MENKWWEYYAVRYFVGTVIGALIIAFLTGPTKAPFNNQLALWTISKDVPFLGVGLAAALGFAFCYVASAPVLVLHAARAHLHLSAIGNRPCLSILCVAIAVTLGSVLSWRFFPPWTAAATGAVIGVQVTLVFLAFFTNFSVIESFYRNLADARSKAMKTKDEPLTPGAEYVTSYRHLREHGNAFAIVILEGILGSALYHLPSIECALYFLGAWLLPATFAWILGSVLESRFVVLPLPPP
jgi:uncharacterized membrane-anchored protein YhcB (DUF1043 family)